MARTSLRAYELGAFLRSRRCAVTPDTVGLPSTGTRRTSGLRREEVARLASVSPGYYQRLEQGRVPQPSTAVLDSLARALRLSAEERLHLFALAGQLHPEPDSEPLTSAARSMLDLLSPPTAAYVIDRHSDVLAWNESAAALFSHLRTGPGNPNNVRFVFTHPQARTLFVDWAEIAADSVAHLRAATGHHPEDGHLAELVAQLTETSTDFRRLWAARPLRHKVEGRKELHHPQAGHLTLDYAVLAVPTTPGQRLVAYTAPPGSPSHTALLTLGLPERLP